MPYVITTTTPPRCPDCGEPIHLTDSRAWWNHDGLSGECWRMSMDGPGEDFRPVPRHAVATLDEARDHVHEMRGYPQSVWQAIAEMPEGGMTVGPLPDGTVIEVERVSGYALLQRIPHAEDRLGAQDVPGAVAAYNAAQEA